MPRPKQTGSRSVYAESPDAVPGPKKKEIFDDFIFKLTNDFNKLTTRERSSPLHKTPHISRHDVLSLEHSGTTWSAVIQAPHESRPKLRIPILRKNAYRKSTKTVALVYTGMTDPLRVTVSGWSDSACEVPSDQLPNSIWTKRAFAVAAEMGYEISQHKYDKGVPGRFHACHAERQAIAYVYYECQKVEKALIHVTKVPCNDCSEFIAEYRRFTGTRIRIIVDGKLWKNPFRMIYASK